MKIVNILLILALTVIVEKAINYVLKKYLKIPLSKSLVNISIQKKDLLNNTTINKEYSINIL